MVQTEGDDKNEPREIGSGKELAAWTDEIVDSNITGQRRAS